MKTREQKFTYFISKIEKPQIKFENQQNHFQISEQLRIIEN